MPKVKSPAMPYARCGVHFIRMTLTTRCMCGLFARRTHRGGGSRRGDRNRNEAHRIARLEPHQRAVAAGIACLIERIANVIRRLHRLAAEPVAVARPIGHEATIASAAPTLITDNLLAIALSFDIAK